MSIDHSNLHMPAAIGVNQACVSVVMPVYNAASTLRAAIETVRTQTFQDWELLLVDDCSTDQSPEIIEQYARDDERVRALRMSSNAGPAATRNLGIESARGRYIAFLDSDDLWLDSKLEKQIKTIEQYKAAICFSSYYKFTDQPNQLRKLVTAKPLVDYRLLLKSNFIGLSTALYDTSLVGKVLMPTIGHEDYALWLTILRDGHSAVGLKEPLVKYRVHSGSVSSNKLKAAGFHWNVLRSVAGLSRARAAINFIFYAYYALRKY